MSKTKTSTHWLVAMCDPTHHKELVQHPWLVSWMSSDPWTLATDGRQLVLLRGHHADAPEAPPDVLARFQPMLDAVTTVPLDWPRFAAWVGPVPHPVVCECCGGDSQCECPRCKTRHDCGGCGGAGLVDPGPAPVRFRGHLVDRHRLARLLPHLDGTGSVTTAWVPSSNSADGSHMLVVDGAGWRLCLIEMQRSEKDWPAFEETVP